MLHAPHAQPPERILLYSHDSYGLGHLRRTLTLAGALAERFHGASVLIVSGSPCATHFALPRGVEIVKLPSVTKNGDGQYAPRSLHGGLDQLERLRRALLGQAFDAFEPQLLIADHQPIGLDGELLEVLRRARRRGTRTLLGLRDIIDDPKTVAAQWSHPDIREALATLYDRVCVYGTPEVFDQRVEYPIPPELSARVEFTGYVVRPAGAPKSERTGPIHRPHVVVTAGGGEDGEGHVATYLECLALAPAEWDTTLVLGPLMHSKEVRQIKRAARALRNVRVHTFHADMPRLFAESDAVVSMAGYNSVAEILQARVNTVLLPRVFPRREQLIRAQRLEQLGLARCLVEARPSSLRAAVEEALELRRAWGTQPRLDGHLRVGEIAAELLAERPAALPAQVRG
jgi:predicted glycosyltransferase